MKAVCMYGPRDLRLDERLPEAVGTTEVRVEVAYSAICGTELHVITGLEYGNAPSGVPRPLGHEFSGRVVEVGRDVTSLSIGERVTAIPGGPCQRCLICRTGRASVCPNRVTGRGGSWASSLVVPAELIYKLPDDVSDRAGAIAEPLACAIRAVDRADLRSGDRVCIVGGGPIGLLVLMVARASGARTTIVSEPSSYRRALARSLGADRVVDPQKEGLLETVADLTDGLGADVVFEAVGQPATVEQAIAVAAPGGMVVVVGVADRPALARFSPQEMFFKELTIRGTKGVTHAMDRALRWLNKLDFESVITHTFPLEQLHDAVELSLSGNAGKVLLRP